MGRPKQNGHVRTFYKKQYRLISVVVDGVRRQRFEHRLVMEEKLGRKLLPEEIVHHKDEEGLNNDPDNLELTTSFDHQHHHLMTGPRKWNLEEALVLRFEESYTIDAIAAHFKVSASSILSAFSCRGIPTSNLLWGKNKWDVDEAIVLYHEGSTLAAIARHFGIKPPSVRKAFLKRKVQLR
jgi:hypothetical protein